MASAPCAGRAVALSNLDLPHAQDLLLHGCEDCACPVSEEESEQRPASFPPPAVTDSRRWVSGREVVEMRLDRDHQAIFNPVGHGGVVVVDELAHRVFRSFARPTTARDARYDWPGSDDDFERVAGLLCRLDMIHPLEHVQRPDFSRAHVLTAWLHVTNACNLRCPYCYITKSDEGMDESVGRAAIEAVIGSATAHGYKAVKLKYAGGEASLNHRLMTTLHSYARELAAKSGLRLYATLLSNGVALPPALVERLKAERIRVMVSLDGLGDQHDIQRPFASGKPSFPRVDRTINQLIEQHHPPHLSITITGRNADGVAQVVRYALERDLTFSLNLFRDNDCSTAFPDLQYEERSIVSALLSAFGVIETFLPRWSVLGSVLDRGQLLRPQQRSCSVGNDYVVIDQRGRVAKCHMEIERTLGDVFSGDPLQLIRADRATALNVLVEEKKGCRDCTWRYWCSGGCTVATFRATGRYDIKSPNCHIYQAIYPQALRLEGLRLLKYALPPVA
jgi:uncharacterized protein